MAKITWSVFATLACGLFAFIVLLGGSVKGNILPVTGGIKCWAISKTDTFQTNIVNGVFELSNIKPGIYRIAIEAIPPYKNAVKEGVDIRNGEVTDLGEIRLEQ